MINQEYTPKIWCPEFTVVPHIMIHVMPWFIPGNSHSKATGITYDSRDPGVINRQIGEIAGFGIQGINVDYYGPHDVPLETASYNLLLECERQSLVYSVCMDKGIFSGSDSPATKQAKFEAALTHVKNMYMPNAAYWRVNGRPVVNFFMGNDNIPDWSRMRAIVPNALFIFQGRSGYARAQSDGAFAWITNPTWGTGNPDPSNIGLTYLRDFYATPNLGKFTLGGCWPGFDDKLASWSKKRVMTRNNGCTLLQTIGAAHGSVPAVLVETFNDHEEGSGIEFGIAVVN